jgi:hypothetical protein
MICDLARRAAALTVLALLACSVPVRAQDWPEETPAGPEQAVPESGAPELNLPRRAADVRNPAAGPETGEARVFRLDAFPEPVRIEAPEAPTSRTSPGWKWLAIGAGAAGAAVTALVTGGSPSAPPSPSPGPVRSGATVSALSTDAEVVRVDAGL